MFPPGLETRFSCTNADAQDHSTAVVPLVVMFLFYFCRPISESKVGSNAGSFSTQPSTNFDTTTHARTSSVEATLTSQRFSESRRACPLRAPPNEITSCVPTADQLHKTGLQKFKCACSEKKRKLLNLFHRVCCSL